MLSYLLHREVRFAIRQSATNESSGARCVARIEYVDVKRDAVTGSALRSDRDRLVHAGAHAALVDLAHREETHAELFDQFSFTGIDVARANMRTQFRIELGRETGDVC